MVTGRRRRESIRAFTVILELLTKSQIGIYAKVKLSRIKLINLILLIMFSVAAGKESGERDLRLGGAINLFSRYGYLSISMRVVPRNDTDPKWIYREPTIDVFKDISPFVMAPENNNRKIEIFHGDFHMEFCDNLGQLLQAYFRNFKFEKLDRPWRAFSGSWSRTAMAKYLGVNSNFITGHYCYVLVRVSRHRETSRMRPVESGNVEMEEEIAQGTREVIPGNETSMTHFFKNFGSHYIVSYTTGNSLYQVFVYTSQIYSKIKERLGRKGVSALSTVELSTYFSPWYAEHVGEIQSASGNLTTQAWAAENLRVHFYFFTYPSLLKVHGNEEILRILNEILGNEAVLALDMRTLAPAFKNPKKRSWFLEVIDNYLKLWETNM